MKLTPMQFPSLSLPALAVLLTLGGPLIAASSACGPDDDHDNHDNHDDKSDMGGGDEDLGGGDEDQGNDEGVRDETPISTPDTYSFMSPYEASQSSVAFSGQTSRHAFIAALNSYISSGLETDAIAGTLETKDDFNAALLFFYEVKGEEEPDLEHTLTLSGDNAATYTLSPQKHVDISKDGRLRSKFAGNDSVTDYKDWFQEFQGWEGQSSAEGLLLDFFDQLATQAETLASGTRLKSPYDDSVDLPLYVTPEGVDLKQMTQKLLLMGITFAQAADDYLDDDPANEADFKGLYAKNTLSEGKPYTGLEHVWDEGFGYFGSAYNYDQYTDEQIADGIQIDGNGDDVITLGLEYNLGASINAAKRDKGSTSGTDYTTAIFDAFREGRTLIVNAGEEVSEEEREAIRAQRDIVIENWEEAIAATVVHYINDTVIEMDKHTDGDDATVYSHAEHAKVWSELKAFALGLQFNRHSPLIKDGSTKFVEFHDLVGDAPVLPSATETDFADYRAALLSARAILEGAYGFDGGDVENW